MKLTKDNSNIVVISDLHLDTWPRGNPDSEKDFRMKVQPHKLAERITRVMAEEETDYLFILGDLINAWSAEPQVMEVLVDFYQTLIDLNPDIYIGYILGQHDMRVRDVFTEDNSYVHLVARMFPNNVHYMHNRIIDLNYTTIHFSSYCRKGVIYPKDKVNIILSHITFGQVEIDESRADLFVAGDIHDFYDQGKCHSVGTPFQHYAHQPQKGVIGVIKLAAGSSTFKRVPSDDLVFEFLKLQPVQRNAVDKDSSRVNIEYSESELLKMISAEVEKNEVKDIHDCIDISKSPQAVGFKYQLHKMVIDNVRSIEHLDLDFDDLTGITYIAGQTGAGKSSIFWSIEAALTGCSKDTMIRWANKITGRPMRIQLWLSYDGQDYYIDRAVDNLTFSINGENVTMSKRETQKKIEECLPFVKYWDFFHLHAGRHYFDTIDKVELLRVLFNLSVFDYLYLSGKELLKVSKRELKDNQSEQLQLTGAISAREEDLANVNDLLLKASIPILSKADVMELEQREVSLERQRVDLYSSYLKAKADCDSISKRLSETSCMTEDEFKKANEEIGLLRDKIKAAEEQNVCYAQKQRQVMYFDSRLSGLKGSTITKCPHCGGILHGPTQADIEKAEKDLEFAKQELLGLSQVVTDDLYKPLRTLEAKIMEYNSFLNMNKSLEFAKKAEQEAKTSLEPVLTQLKTIYEHFKLNDHAACVTFISDIKAQYRNIDGLEAQKHRIEDDLSLKKERNGYLVDNIKKIEDKNVKLEKYISLFDMKNMASIPYSILSKLVNYLTTETIRFETFTGDEEDAKFNVSCSLKLGEHWIPYEDASDGQKNYLDMYILIRITQFLGGVGLLILDEPLSNMDPNYIEKASSLIPEIKADTLLVSSHATITGYDRAVLVRQNDLKLTEVSFK